MSTAHTFMDNFSPQSRVMDAGRRPPGAGTANGTFGELLQGALRNDDDHFLVTLPIRKYSRARFEPDYSSAQVSVQPAHKCKSLKLVQRLLRHYDCEFGGTLTIESDLPEGKGLASSSADMVACVRALEASLGFTIPTELVLAELAGIEPTDGVMFHEFVTFFHRKVQLVRRLGFPSGLVVVAIDAGGQVDTIEYNRHHHLFSDEECAEYARLLASIENAIRTDDLPALGRIATRSAILNQKRNPNPHFERVMAIGHATAALGVVVAHSGPCVGLLFPGDPACQAGIARAESLLADLTDQVFVVESIAPGPDSRTQHQSDPTNRNTNRRTA